nr:13520_t:CDS:2 [Entrophospora candida]
MGNNTSTPTNNNTTVIIQNFGNVNNIDPVCEAISIPNAPPFPRDGLKAQLAWIDKSALDYLKANWSDHYRYIWDDNETKPDGAVTHGAIFGTGWFDQNFTGAIVADYLEAEITDGFNQSDLTDLGKHLGKVIQTLLKSPEQSFQDQEKTFTIGDKKVAVYYAGGVFNSPKGDLVFVSYLLSWFTPSNLPIQ